ncbi:PAS domain S-box protein [Rhodocytophaga aerolata]|uniref:PAS domain S-box protein n=2 Tax=Rhodocytophaga aerolata TaxID=455078 RepID=A0ABT8RCE8_9BACT|nr:PAS domain S-box protein [Rhodocytophaga aerolata]
MVANGLGGIYYTRVVLPTMLLLLSSLYNAFFSTSLDDAITSVSLVELSFTLIPFIVFDFREKGFLLFCTIFSFFILVVFPLSWGYFDMGYDGSVLREGPLAVLTTCLALFAQIGSIYGLAVLNRQSEERSTQLLSEMNEKSTEAEQARKALEVNLEKLEIARTEEANRQWTSEGIAKVAEILRSHGAGSHIYDSLISMIVKYMGANQGGVYVVDETEPGQKVIRLMACYAYERKKYIDKSFAPGQGMLGQAYLEAEYIYMTQVPKNYITITSGLGEATPTALLIMPLKINDTVEGMLEIASFHKLAPHQISFMEKIAENIAGFIQNNRINEQTKKLLESSLQQTEEMRAQEEEMRQNMEELEATQEEMRRNEQAHLDEIARLMQEYHSNTGLLQKKDQEMSGFMLAVDSTLAMVELTLEGIILTANERFLSLMGYTLPEITGKHHRLFVDAAHSQTQAYTEFWQKLSQGEEQIGEVRRQAKNGKDVYLSASYTPVFNEEKEVVKIIKFAQDITQEKQAALDYQSQLEAISKSNGIVEFDLNGNILSANANFLALMKYEAKEIYGRHHRIFVKQVEQESEEYQQFWEKLRSGEYISGEFERVSKDGTNVWIKGNYTPIADINGKIYKIVKYAQDVTEQKMLERQTLLQTEELRAQEEEIRQNLEELQATQEEAVRQALELQAHVTAVDASLATIEFDLQGNILKANQNFLTLMGYELEEITHQPHRIFVEKGYGASSEYHKFWQDLKEGKAQIGKVKRLTKQGKQVWLNASYTPVFDEKDQLVKIIKLAQAIES